MSPADPTPAAPDQAEGPQPDDIRLVDDLITAVSSDAHACEDGGFGDYKDERKALLDHLSRLRMREIL